MKTRFVVVIQKTGSKFDVMHFEAESQSRLYPLTSPHGVCVSIFESNKSTDEYSFAVADQLNTLTK